MLVLVKQILSLELEYQLISWNLSLQRHWLKQADIQMYPTIERINAWMVFLLLRVGSLFFYSLFDIPLVEQL